MPGSRALAEQVGVHRNTVVAAYAELTAQGFLRTDPARGTFVHADLGLALEAGSSRRPIKRGDSQVHRAHSSRRASTSGIGFDLPHAADDRFGLPLSRIAGTQEPEPGTYFLTGGRPDPRLFPAALVARAYRRVLRREGRRVLDYGDAMGHPRLRHALADMLTKVRSLAVDLDGVLVTRGSQMGLDLVFGALIRPGDRVAVEAYGYPPAWAAMRRHGAQLCPVRVDDAGMCVDRLESLQAKGPLRCVYLTPHHQYPTTTTLSAARRIALLEFARRHRVAVVEDDYDYEYHYEGRPVPPVASADDGHNVIYVGSLSKVLAPGLRIGYVVAPAPLLERMARMRVMIDRQGDLTTEAALAELFEDGDVQRHIWRTARVYQARRDAFVVALREQLPGALTFTVPPGGLAMWARVEQGLDADAWAARALARRVWVVPGRHCHIDGRKRPYLRLGFTRHDESELVAAVRLLARTR